jgi:hypothetical protein
MDDSLIGAIGLLVGLVALVVAIVASRDKLISFDWGTGCYSVLALGLALIMGFLTLMMLNNGDSPAAIGFGVLTIACLWGSIYLLKMRVDSKTHNVYAKSYRIAAETPSNVSMCRKPLKTATGHR